MVTESFKDISAFSQDTLAGVSVSRQLQLSSRWVLSIGITAAWAQIETGLLVPASDWNPSESVMMFPTTYLFGSLHELSLNPTDLEKWDRASGPAWECFLRADMTHRNRSLLAWRNTGTIRHLWANLPSVSSGHRDYVPQGSSHSL